MAQSLLSDCQMFPRKLVKRRKGKAQMAKIVLHGDCLIGRVSQLHELLLQHLEQPDQRLEIDMTGVERCDLSFFQLLCAASRSFASKNKTLCLADDLPETVIRQIAKTGMGPACSSCLRLECLLREPAGSCPAVEI
jgi:anti-anti-sigma regulatory factor